MIESGEGERRRMLGLSSSRGQRFGGFFLFLFSNGEGNDTNNHDDVAHEQRQENSKGLCLSGELKGKERSKAHVVVDSLRVYG